MITVLELVIGRVQESPQLHAFIHSFANASYRDLDDMESKDEFH